MINKILFCIAFIASIQQAVAQQWPYSLNGENKEKITIYQPQAEKLEANKITGRAALSVKLKPTDDPVFGALWFTASMETDRDTRMMVLQGLHILDIKLSGINDSAQLNHMRSLLESELPKAKFKTTIDDITTSIEQEQHTTSTGFKNDPPKIIYATKPSILVPIDGEPKLQDDEKLHMKRVINTAFLIVQYPKDNSFYLYGGNNWYTSENLLSGWAPSKKLPQELQELDKQIKAAEAKSTQAAPAANLEAQEIIISTSQAELVQSKGEAVYASIAGTKLLYVSNSPDNIFMDINANKYYVLLSGRWYRSSSLKSAWEYVANDQLPADFSKIPKGSEKDNVLASVAGTDAARDAVMDAQVPQTAKVDRDKATCQVSYDGEPVFEKIEGTNLYLAKNTGSTVIKSGDAYYCVENGIWFRSVTPAGPWKVADDRPKDVENIPAGSAAYNVKYVYIYESTPQYIYVGYTPAYMGCYVSGAVVVYGTGFYYNPWYGPYYYPHPVTYGFSMHYNPWTGWSIGFHYSYGFFSFHYYTHPRYGYWGPPIYRPPYHPVYHGGMYGGRGPTYIGGDVNININHSNNIYSRSNGVNTNDIKRPSPGGVNNTANNKPSTANSNNVVTDRQGNLFEHADQSNWNKRDGNSWKPAGNASTTELNKQMQDRQRSQVMNKNYNQVNNGNARSRSSSPGASGTKRR